MRDSGGRCGRIRGAAALAVCGLLLLLGGCVATPQGGERLNLWPLLCYQADPGTETLEVEILGPLLSWHRRGPSRSFTLAPLFYLNREGEDSSTAEFLYPLGQYRRQGPEAHFNLVPLSNWRVEEDGATSGQLFPFFWGRTAGGQAYGGIFPLYGIFKERFQRQQLTFLLWPLYSSSQGEGTKTYRLCWPFFTWSRGEEQAAVFWPLAGRFQRPGVYDKYYALWPLLHYQDLNLDQPEPRRVRMVLPFWVSDRTPSSRRTAWLFPFFAHYQQDRGPYEQWDLGWPFWVQGQGDGFVLRQYFPWYSSRRQRLEDGGLSERLHILWPLWSRERELTAASWRLEYRFLVGSRYLAVVSETGAWREEWRCWPWARGWAEEGAAGFASLALLPLDSPGWERLWGPYLELARWEGTATGRAGRALWGLYRWEKGPTYSLWELGFLAAGQTTPQGCRYRFLAGMFGWEQEGGRRELRLFFLPWRWQAD